MWVPGTGEGEDCCVSCKNLREEKEEEEEEVEMDGWRSKIEENRDRAMQMQDPK